MKQKILLIGVLVAALGMISPPVLACQLQYTGEAAKMFGSAPRGSFNCLEECENYRRSSPGFEKANSRCVNCSKCSAGGYGSSEDFAMQMLGSVFGSMLKSIFEPPQPDTAYQQQQAEAEKKAMEQLLYQLQKEEKSRMAQEEAQKKKQGELLAKKMEGVGSGKLEPFRWETPKLESKPIGTGVFDTSGYSSWQRLICAAYFSNRALQETRNENPEGAAFMNTQADKVTAGEWTDVECKLPGLQQLPETQKRNLQQNAKMQKMVELLSAAQPKIKHLQEIEIKLNEARKQKEEAEAKLKESDKKIEEAKEQAQNAKTLEEKTQADDLVCQALTLRSDAQAQLSKAKQSEEEYTQLREKDLKEIQDLEQELKD